MAHRWTYGPGEIQLACGEPAVFDSLEKTRALALAPRILCPVCRTHVGGIAEGRLMYPEPEGLVVPKEDQILRWQYSLHPCHCQVSQEWAASFTLELNQRIATNKGHAVSDLTHAQRAERVVQLQERITTLYARRDKAGTEEERKLADYLLLAHADQLTRLFPGTTLTDLSQSHVAAAAVVHDWHKPSAADCQVIGEFGYGPDYPMPRLAGAPTITVVKRETGGVAVRVNDREHVFVSYGEALTAMKPLATAARDPTRAACCRKVQEAMLEDWNHDQRYRGCRFLLDSAGRYVVHRPDGSKLGEYATGQEAEQRAWSHAVSSFGPVEHVTVELLGVPPSSSFVKVQQTIDGLDDKPAGIMAEAYKVAGSLRHASNFERVSVLGYLDAHDSELAERVRVALAQVDQGLAVVDGQDLYREPAAPPPTPEQVLSLVKMAIASMAKHQSFAVQLIKSSVRKGYPVQTCLDLLNKWREQFQAFLDQRLVPDEEACGFLAAFAESVSYRVMHGFASTRPGQNPATIEAERDMLKKQLLEMAAQAMLAKKQAEQAKRASFHAQFDRPRRRVRRLPRSD